MSFNHTSVGKLHLLSALMLILAGSASAAIIKVTNTADSGTGSLRNAIILANSTPEADTIDFSDLDAGTTTILCSSGLPLIINPLTIDGTTKSDYAGVPLVRISGASAGPAADGLQIAAPNCVVRGVMLTNWSVRGILITSSNNTIQGCYLGTEGTTTTANAYGVAVQDPGVGLTGNLIGGPGAGQGNVISGNSAAGILIQGPQALGTVIKGNVIGLNPAGTSAIPNAGTGIYIVNAANTQIGGTAAGEGNVISGNGSYGVYLAGTPSSGSIIQGNLIGTNASGTAAIGNGIFGVTLDVVNDVIVGGALPAARNVISGNGGGIQISGIGSSGNTIAGNYIGTDVTGTADLGNLLYGIYVAGPNNVIGGTAAGAGNVVSGNGLHGVVITGAAGNTIQGNYIGTNATGTAALPNEIGVVIDAVTGQVVGGSAAGAGNLVSGNGAQGIYLQNCTGNLVQGNRVGTDAAGTADLGNGAEGISLVTTYETTVGGTLETGGNVVSGNETQGISVYNSTDIAVQGNRVGVGVTGGALGNGTNGVAVAVSIGVLIGGTETGEGNIIAHNSAVGVLPYTTAVTTRIHGNIIRDNGTSCEIDWQGDGPTPNDSPDSDGVTNKPVIGTVDNSNPSVVTVQTTLSASPSTEYIIEYFSTPSAEMQGIEFLYRTNVTTDASGQAALSPTFSVTTPLPTGAYVTATATPTGSGGTSEFSLAGYVPVTLSGISIE